MRHLQFFGVLVGTILCTMMAATPVFAGLGVGIGTGKIILDKPLQPGSIYTLPPIVVINTGDIESTYTVGTSYRNKQEELVPDKQWFAIEPKEFVLKPGETKEVTVRLQIPVKVVPGKYFAFVEGRAGQQSANGETGVGLAAASKLYFEVTPANIFIGIFYRLKSLWELYSPWSTIIPGTLLFFVVMKIASKFIKINISVATKHEKQE